MLHKECHFNFLNVIAILRPFSVCSSEGIQAPSTKSYYLYFLDIGNYYRALVRAGGMGGMPPVNFSQRVAAPLSNKATVARHPPVFSIFTYFNPLLTDFPPVI